MPDPTYSFSQSAVGTVNEGAVLVTTVQTQNVGQNSRIYWKADGTNINADDFVSTGAGINGNITLDSTGKFTVTHRIAADNNTEGTETLRLKFFSDVTLPLNIK